MTCSPFFAVRIDLQGARLVALAPALAARLAEAIVAIPPWSAMDYPADAMARFLAASGDGASRYLIEVDGVEAGAVSVRHPWLKGPYLELLALLPPFQRHGIGAGMFPGSSRRGERSARAISGFAPQLQRARLALLIRSHGFSQAAALPGLVADGYEEILLAEIPAAGRAMSLVREATGLGCRRPAPRRYPGADRLTARRPPHGLPPRRRGPRRRR